MYENQEKSVSDIQIPFHLIMISFVFSICPPLDRIDMMLERPAESIYAAISIFFTCSTRRQCFENEVPNRIEKEYGERLKRMPNEYDPKEWAGA